MKKLFSVLLALLMLVTAAAFAEAPAFDAIEFPDNMPAGIYSGAQELDYSYDDMSQSYDIEIVNMGYGSPQKAKDDDPILAYMEKAFNVNITWTIVESADLETHLSTRIAAGDYPDMFVVPNREFAFQLDDAGVMLDCREVYPYLPLHQKYVTKGMIQYSTNKNGTIPFVTKYGIQDGVWCAAIRRDWLEKFGMEMPTTKEQLIEYAKACTFNDPDGNGIDDTWFMTGAGSGKSLGMINNIFCTMSGPAQAYVDENGQLSHPYFDGQRKEFLSFAKELYDLNVLAPDWYTIDWETAKSYTLNDKIGMLYYPAGALYQEYGNAKQDSSVETIGVWEFMAQYPVEGGKYAAAGNPGYMWAFAKPAFEGNEGKLLRVLHMLDTMAAGGENFAHTIQTGDSVVFEDFGIEMVGRQEVIYTDDGMFYLQRTGKDENGGLSYPYDDASYGGLNLASWQNFGLNVSWQLTDANTGNEVEDAYAALVNEAIVTIAGVDRWPNYGLQVSLTGEAAEAASTLTDWVNAAEFEFVTGARSLDDYDAFTAEWLSKGGKSIVEQTAACLGCEVPDYAK